MRGAANKRARLATMALASVLFLILAGKASYAAETAGELPPPNPTRNVYFGDLHLHTSMSFDAVASRTSTLPEEAYRFARGEPIEYFGRTVTRNAPLDFLAVTDHAEYLGMSRVAADPHGPFADTEWPKLLSGPPTQMLMQAMMKFSASGFLGGPPVKEFLAEEYIKGNWQRQIDAAEKHYRPGKFTTFVAFEWSAMPDRLHLHRNVIFRGPRYPDRPFSAIDSMQPEDLWQYAENQRRLGNDSVLIPHNSNLSGGLMFSYTDSYGKPIDRGYAQARARNEPLVEITQNKGTSETRPELSPTDEFAGFELLDSTHSAVLDGSHVRQALQRGLQIKAQVGVNPFAYGLIGSTDFHSGLSTSEESNFPGGLGVSDSQADPRKALTADNPIMGAPTTVLSASGLTGVWAEQNTRESIFAALQRKEAFATSGGRIAVRLFAGWTYPAGMTRRSTWVEQAYEGGVPMGADLPPRPRGARSPRFLVHALKDPDAGNLDRIQIVKLWFKDGESHEEIFDVIWSGKRRPGRATGKLPAVGNTVDLKTATYTNDIGAAQLLGEWTDPRFDPEVSAIYYARVLEIPTPRWSTYLAVRNALALSRDVPATIQERAWTSPIFYGP